MVKILKVALIVLFLFTAGCTNNEVKNQPKSQPKSPVEQALYDLLAKMWDDTDTYNKLKDIQGSVNVTGVPTPESKKVTLESKKLFESRYSDYMVFPENTLYDLEYTNTCFKQFYLDNLSKQPITKGRTVKDIQLQDIKMTVTGNAERQGYTDYYLRFSYIINVSYTDGVKSTYEIYCQNPNRTQATVTNKEGKWKIEGKPDINNESDIREILENR